MGYTTKFEGKLLFGKDVTVGELLIVKKFMGIDLREHKELIEGYPPINIKLLKDCPYITEPMTHVNFMICDDFSGIEWNGTEKFYNAVEKTNLIIWAVQQEYPNFKLSGELQAQGEDLKDKWVLKIGEDGLAIRVDVPPVGKVVTCPHCEEEFIIED